ncbi:MAG: dUTP diphosphatase [Phycisphaerales bacterium]
MSSAPSSLTPPATTSTTHPPLKVRRLDPRATLPRYQTAGSAGMDLAACLERDDATLVIEPGRILAVPTRLSMAIPAGYEAQVRPRSGLATKSGVTLPNAPGTIDSDYRGEVLVPLINLGSEAFTVTHGMRVAQLVIAPVAQVTIEETTELDATARGEGGFGSTGRH